MCMYKGKGKKKKRNKEERKIIFSGAYITMDKHQEALSRYSHVSDISNIIAMFLQW